MPQSIRNYAILAHVDAGKTTLAERTLFNAGEVRHPGNVEDGLATLDYLPEEKERGITIEAGIASFLWKDCWFSILDTPGHIDFGAEVDLALDAVEGAVLVLSGTGGVETQSLEAWRKLRSRGIRTLLFINKLDHPDSRLEDILLELEEAFQIRPLLLNWPQREAGRITAMADVVSRAILVQDAQGREVPGTELADAVRGEVEGLRRELVEAAATADDELLSCALEGGEVSPVDLVRGLRKLFVGNEYAACYCGSALTNRGVRQLMTGLGLFLDEAGPSADGRLGQVVRIRHGRSSGEIALFKSALNRSRSQWPEGFEFKRVRGDLLLPVEHVRPGDLYALQCGARRFAAGEILDTAGVVRGLVHRKFAYTPLVQTGVECVAAEQWTQVDAALDTLARSDPSLRVERDNSRGSWLVRTVGEVHLDVVMARLRREFHCDVRHGQPRVNKVERLRSPVGPLCNRFTTPQGSLAVELWAAPVDCTQQDSVFDLQWECSEPESLHIQVCQEALAEFLQTGILGFGPLEGVDFRVVAWQQTGVLAPGAIKKAVSDALRLGVAPDHIYGMEPWVHLEIHCPDGHVGVILGDLQSRGAEIGEWSGDGKFCKIFALAPLEKVFGYSIIVRSISKGTASYALRYERHREVAKVR